jgi:hypothetical protein
VDGRGGLARRRNRLHLALHQRPALRRHHPARLRAARGPPQVPRLRGVGDRPARRAARGRPVRRAARVAADHGLCDLEPVALLGPELRPGPDVPASARGAGRSAHEAPPLCVLPALLRAGLPRDPQGRVDARVRGRTLLRRIPLPTSASCRWGSASASSTSRSPSLHWPTSPRWEARRRGSCARRVRGSWLRRPCWC